MLRGAAEVSVDDEHRDAEMAGEHHIARKQDASCQGDDA
jgi:hypothetical protein